MKVFSHSAFTGWIGVARKDITPPVGIFARNWGASNHDQAVGVHKPLTLTALTLQDAEDNQPLVLIAMDGPWWKTSEDEWLVRGAILDAFSLDPARVVLHLSHTHSGPSLSLQDRDRPGGDKIEPYLHTVRDAAVSATRQAIQAHTEATLSWHQGKCDLACNRTYFDEQRQRLVCGFNPAGDADDTLLVGRVTGSSGKVIAIIVNYACHPTTLAWENRLLSPDFVGAMREIVERQFQDAPCLYLQGASGELAPREQYTDDTKLADAHGRQLAYSVLAVIEGMLPPMTSLQYVGSVESGASLALWKRSAQEPSRDLGAICRNVALPLKRIHTLEEIEIMLRTCADRLTEEKLRRERATRWLVGNDKVALLPVWIWRVGDAFLVGHTEEAFSLLQTELRRRFAPQTIVVMNLVNGGVAGYLPPRDLYTQEMYEVSQTPYERGSLELLMDTASAGIEELNRLT